MVCLERFFGVLFIQLLLFRIADGLGENISTVERFASSTYGDLLSRDDPIWKALYQSGGMIVHPGYLSLCVGSSVTCVENVLQAMHLS